MSDTNKFINTYVDHAVGMIHENINAILQLKTQIKIANDLNAEKDSVVGRLIQELEEAKQDNEVIRKLREEVKLLQETNESLAYKQSHLHTAINQISDMKKMVQERDTKIAELEKKISKKAINSKKNTNPIGNTPDLPEKAQVNSEVKTEKNDDF